MRDFNELLPSGLKEVSAAWAGLGFAGKWIVLAGAVIVLNIGFFLGTFAAG